MVCPDWSQGWWKNRSDGLGQRVEFKCQVKRQDDEIRWKTCHTEGHRGIQMPDEARSSSYEEMPQTLSHCLQFFLSNFEIFKFCILNSMYKISSLPHPIFCFRYRLTRPNILNKKQVHLLNIEPKPGWPILHGLHNSILPRIKKWDRGKANQNKPWWVGKTTACLVKFSLSWVEKIL